MLNSLETFIFPQRVLLLVIVLVRYCLREITERAFRVNRQNDQLCRCRISRGAPKTSIDEQQQVLWFSSRLATKFTDEGLLRVHTLTAYKARLSFWPVLRQTSRLKRFATRTDRAFVADDRHRVEENDIGHTRA